jgi:hypothetical protein
MPKHVSSGSRSDPQFHVGLDATNLYEFSASSDPDVLVVLCLLAWSVKRVKQHLEEFYIVL